MARYVRYDDNGAARHGLLEGDAITPLNGSFPDFSPSGTAPVALASVRLLAPVVPGKVVAIGPGYRILLGSHPLPDRPYYWIKPTSALLDPEGTIELPALAPMVCHESELAIVIGRKARNVDPEEARGCIFGYTCINDVTAGNMLDRAEYRASLFFVDGKMFDTFAPLGPAIATDVDPTSLRIQCRVNGEVRQDHTSSDQIWRPWDLVSLISRTTTLNPGDVIGTGSPPNPGPLAPGDVVEVEIEGIGILRNRVAARSF